MNLIGKTGSPSIRGHTVLCVLLGLLVSAASSQPTNSSEGEVSFLKLKLNLLMNRYRHLCNQYSNLPPNCSSSVNCTQCPDGWFVVGDQCFLLITDKDNYHNSANKCAELGAHLAILTTKEQHDAVEQEFGKIGGIYTYYWIGLTDIDTEGDWRWVDNSKVNNTFWDTVEPYNNQPATPDEEDCAVVNSQLQTWSTVPCSFAYPRICQMDVIPLQ